MDSVKILIVEDESIEALDVKRTLELFGYQVPYIVSRGDEAVRIAQELKPDLVLMDIVLKGDVDGIDAAFQIKDLGIPLIYLTAHSEESTIERAKHSEPYGYLIKPYDGTELKHTIDLALYKNKMEKQLRESEQRYRMLFENSQISTAITTFEGRVITANKYFSEMTGYQPRELSEIDLGTMYQDISQRNHIIKTLQEQGTITDFEVKLVRKDGEKYIASLNVDLIPHQKETAMMVTAIDITKRVQAEKELRKSEKRYRNLYSTMSEGVAIHRMIYDEKGQPLDYEVIDVNPAYEQILEIKKEDIIDKRASEIYGSQYAPFLDIYAGVVHTRKPTQFETYYAPMDKYFHITVFAPSPGKFATIFEDISPRKMVEKRLKSSNRLYSTLSQINQALIKINDVDQLYKTICKISVEYGGFRMAWVGLIDPVSGKIKPHIHHGSDDGYLEIINLNINDPASPEHPSIQAIKTEELVIVEDIKHNLNREWCGEALQRNYHSMASMPLKFRGKIIGIFNLYATEPYFFNEKENELVREMGLDISFALDSISLQEEHNKFEQALQESEKNYRELVDNSMVAVYRTTLEGDMIFANQSMADMFHYPSVEDLMKINVIELYKNQEGRQIVVDKLKDKGSFRQFEIEGISYKGEIINILLSASLTDDTLSGMMMDITDRKRAESELKESEERYSLTLAAVNDGIWDWNVLQGTAYFSPTYYTMLGYEVDEFPASYESFRSLVHPDEIESVEKKLQEFVEQARGYALEFRLRTKDNDWIWILARGRVVDIDEEGHSQRMVGTHTNITARKEVEEALLKSERRYRDLFDSVPVGLGVFNWNGVLIEANQELEDITGYSLEELKTFNLENYFADTHDGNKIMFLMQQAGNISDYEVELRRKNGDLFYALINCEMIDLEGDKIVIAFRDITINKKLDIELKESEQKFKTVADHTYDWEYWVAPGGELIYVSPSCERISGYRPDEFIKKPSLLEEITHPDDVPTIQGHLLGEAVSEKEIQHIQFRIYTKEGAERWIAHVCLPVYDEERNFLGRRASNRDITNHKKAELAVQKSLREKEVLLREVHHRVKNNLQIISSLLHLQESYVEDPEFLNVLKESEGRVKSMAMIHEKLYQSPTFDKINLKEYVKKLAHDILTSYGIRDESLKVILDIDDINLNIDSAIPLGLVINELVTNSVKYAFPQCKGTISIQFVQSAKGLELIVADDGIGLPEDISPQNTATLGLQLVNTLINQVDGEYSIDRSQGTKYQIKFSEIEYKERI